MTAPKTFGQIAWEAMYSDSLDVVSWDGDHSPADREKWERIGAAIALECSRICIELARRHLLQAQAQAQGGDESIACYYRQLAAIECAETIRESISFSTKDTL